MPRKSAVPTSDEVRELHLGEPLPGQVWRICVGCDEPFMTAEPRTRYCCPECREFYADVRAGRVG